MTITQLALSRIPRPADASDCGVLRDRSGAWRVAWLREGRVPEIVPGIDFGSVRKACDASSWLRAQHGLDR